jgi:hypothetical protein
VSADFRTLTLKNDELRRKESQLKIARLAQAQEGQLGKALADEGTWEGGWAEHHKDLAEMEGDNRDTCVL